MTELEPIQARHLQAGDSLPHGSERKGNQAWHTVVSVKAGYRRVEVTTVDARWRRRVYEWPPDLD